MFDWQKSWFVFNADEGGGGAPSSGGVSGAASASTPAPASTPSPVPSAPVASAPAASAAAPAGGGAAPASPADWTGARDFLKGYGLDYSHLPDDAAALQHVALQLRQLSEYQQRMQPHEGRFQEWMRQQGGQQAAPAVPQKTWKAPDYDASWPQALYRDADGNIRVHQGKDPSIPVKLASFLEHREQILNKFAQDPVGLLQDEFKPVMQQIAQEMFQRSFSQHAEQAAAAQILQQNSGWLYAKDQSGQVVLDPLTRQPALSPEGQAYARYVGEAARMGIHDSSRQNDYAFKMVQAEVMAARIQQMTAAQQAAAQGEQAKAAFTQGVQSPPNRSGSGAGTVGAAQPAGTSLQDRLRKNLKAGGYNAHDPIPANGNAA